MDIARSIRTLSQRVRAMIEQAQHVEDTTGSGGSSGDGISSDIPCAETAETSTGSQKLWKCITSERYETTMKRDLMRPIACRCASRAIAEGQRGVNDAERDLESDRSVGK